METRKELEKKVFKTECQDEYDLRYAPIIVKTIVFSTIGLICTCFILWITSLVWPK